MFVKQTASSRDTVPARHPRRARRVLRFVAVGLIAILLIAYIVIRYYSSPGHVEKRLTKVLGPRYHVEIEDSHYSLLRRHFVATGISVVTDTVWAPAKPRDERLNRRNTSFKADEVRVHGVNLSALWNGHIEADELLMEKPEYRLMMDRGVHSKKRDLPRMPHIALASSKTRLRIDKIRITDGDVRYSERARDGNRAGTFRFADLNGSIDNLTNDPKRMTTPCVIDVRTRLANSGPLHATFEYDMSSQPLKMNYQATIGKMDVLTLNELLINLNGIRILEGTIDSMSLDAKIDGDVATGKMKLLYHGLKFELLDKNSHDQGLKDYMASFLQDTNEANPPDDDEPVTVIALRRERAPNISLIKFVWETAREGALRTVGVPQKDQ